MNIISKIALLTAFALAAGCTTVPPDAVPAPSPVAEQPECIDVEASDDEAVDDLGELLAYHQALRQMSAADLGKEIATLNAQPKSLQSAVRKAMALSLTHNSADLALAQTNLDAVANAAEPEVQAFKPLVSLMSADLAEQRRLMDVIERQNQQLKDGQRKVEQLTDKLEALKTIERTLPSSSAPAHSERANKQGGS